MDLPSENMEPEAPAPATALVPVVTGPLVLGPRVIKPLRPLTFPLVIPSLQASQGAGGIGQVIRPISSVPLVGVSAMGTIVLGPGAVGLQPNLGIRLPLQIGPPPGFIEQLKIQIKEVDGSSGKLCRFGRNCKSVDCADQHPEGRDFESDLNSIICRFGRKCKRLSCFYLHPSGRELDEDPSRGQCKDGELCMNMNCIFAHPDTRKAINPLKCFNCGKNGHLIKDCPDGDLPPQGTFVVMRGFPEEWMALGETGLLSEVYEQLKPFGVLSWKPSVKFGAEGGDEVEAAIAGFREEESARAAIEALDGVFFNIEITDPPPRNQGRHGERGGKPGCTAFVGNLPYDWGEEEVRGIFSEVDDVKGIRLVLMRDKDVEGRTSKGYCFVDFKNEAACTKAIQDLNGKEIGGRQLRVTSADQKYKETKQGEATTLIVEGFPQRWSEKELFDFLSSAAKGLISVSIEVGTGEDAPNKAKAKFGSGSELKKAWWDLADQKIAGKALVLTMEGQNNEKSATEPAEVELSGFPAAFSEADLRDFLKGVLQHVQPTGISITTPKESGADDAEASPGRATLTFPSNKDAKDAWWNLEDQQVDGKPLQISMKEGDSRKRDRDSDWKDWKGGDRDWKKDDWKKDSRRRDNMNLVTIHLDELAMPKRPQVEPAGCELEVWVDPLPDEGELDEWLKTFGEVDEVFRVPDISSGEPSDRGYVRFKDHEAGKKCVSSGSATWSESERTLTSQRSHHAQTGSKSVYPESVIARILGPKGSYIKQIQEELGAVLLAIRGKGLGEQENTKASDRVHFVCKLPDDKVEQLQPALEKLMSGIHEDFDRLMKDPKFARDNNKGRSDRRQQSSGRRSRSRSRGQHHPGHGHYGPPPMGYGLPPVAPWGYPPPPGWPGYPPPHGWPPVHPPGPPGHHPGPPPLGAPPLPGWMPPPHDNYGPPPPHHPPGYGGPPPPGYSRPPFEEGNYGPPPGPPPQHEMHHGPPHGLPPHEAAQGRPYGLLPAIENDSPPGSILRAAPEEPPPPSRPSGTGDNFFASLPRDLTEEEEDLADAVLDFLKAWILNHDEDTRPSVVHLGADAIVRGCKVRALPREVALKSWLQRRLSQYVTVSGTLVTALGTPRVRAPRAPTAALSRGPPHALPQAPPVPEPAPRAARRERRARSSRDRGARDPSPLASRHPYEDCARHGGTPPPPMQQSRGDDRGVYDDPRFAAPADYGARSSAPVGYETRRGASPPSYRHHARDMSPPRHDTRCSAAPTGYDRHSRQSAYERAVPSRYEDGGHDARSAPPSHGRERSRGRGSRRESDYYPGYEAVPRLTSASTGHSGHSRRGGYAHADDRASSEYSFEEDHAPRDPYWP